MTDLVAELKALVENELKKREDPLPENNEEIVQLAEAWIWGADFGSFASDSLVNWLCDELVERRANQANK